MKAKLGAIAAGLATAAVLAIAWHPTASEARDGYPAITPGFTVPAPEPTHSHAPLSPIKSPVPRPTDRAPITRNVDTPTHAAAPAVIATPASRCG